MKNLSLDLEIVDFYPKKNSKKSELGSLHIYLVDYDMDIRGIHVKKTNGQIFFILPYKTTKDHETGLDVRYPIIGFTNPTRKKELIGNLLKEFNKYMKERNLR